MAAARRTGPGASRPANPSRPACCNCYNPTACQQVKPLGMKIANGRFCRPFYFMTGGVTAGGCWTTGRPGGYGELSLSPQTRPRRTCRRVTRETDPLLPDEEAEWIRAAQAGEQSAFTHLINRYWDRLYRWLYRMTRDRHLAEDLTQETFLKALAAVKSFRAGSNFRAWV